MIFHVHYGRPPRWCTMQCCQSSCVRINYLSFSTVGLVGNLLNLVVLSCRLRSNVGIVEKTSIVSMNSLAVADFFFCGITLVGSFSEGSKMLYKHWNISLIFILYGPYFQNVFIKTSTFITTVMALQRYYIIVHPAKAFNLNCLRPCSTLMIIISGFIFWIIFQLPILWTFETSKIHCPNKESYIFITVGYFEKASWMRQFFTFSYAVIGFLVPVFILACCNTKIVISCYRSSKRLNQMRRRSSSRRQNNQLVLSITLICIILSFFLLVLPGEVRHLYQDIMREKGVATGYSPAGIIVCNILQACNTSLNFALYCVVNTQFRNTLRSLLQTPSKACQAQLSNLTV